METTIGCAVVFWLVSGGVSMLWSAYTYWASYRPDNKEIE